MVKKEFNSKLNVDTFKQVISLYLTCSDMTLNSANFGIGSGKLYPGLQIDMSACKQSYKVLFLTRGSGHICINGHQHEIKSGSLLFITPQDTNISLSVSNCHSGFHIIFDDVFFASNAADLHELKTFPLFAGKTNPLINLPAEQIPEFENLFGKLCAEYQNEIFDRIICKLYLHLIFRQASKLLTYTSQSSINRTAAFNITSRFFALLEKQFPITSVTSRLKIRLPSAFASELAVHTNHLNACVKLITGKSVQNQINARILSEALFLLKNTDWHIGEIAWVIGFEKSTSFLHFIKKWTGHTPSFFRNNAL